MEDEDFDEFKEATQTNGDSLNVKTEIMLPNENEIINENENFDEKLGVSVENLNEIKTKEQHFSTELNEKENETEDNIEEVIENRAISEKAKDEIFNDMNEKTNEQTKALLKENFNKDFIENDNNFAANEGLEVKELKENNLSCENEDQEVKLKRNCQISNDNLFEKPLENKFVQQHIIFDEMFSQTKIDNGLTYYDKGISNSNENKIIFDAIKVNDDPFEIEKNDIKEILKIEASIPYEFDIQEKNRNLNESKQNIISRSDEHIIIMPESIPEVIKHNETIFEAKEESSKIDFFREVNEEIENQTKDPLFDQEEERKDLQISPDRDNEIDREEQNRLIPERTNLELISKDGLLPEDEERKLVVNSYENKDKENLLEEQKEYSIKDEKNINMEQLLDNKRKELEENDIFRNFEENQDQNNMPIQSEKEEIELEKEKDETVLKKLQSPKNSLTNDDKNLKVIVQNFENEDDNDNDKDENDNFGEFEEHRPITQKNIFETENLIQNNQNNPKESEPKIIEKNLTIAENEQNSNQIPISKISEIKNENEDSFGNFEENNFCDSEAKSENPNVILSITKAEVANSELKDQEIKLNEPKMEKECRIQEIDFDEGFDDFQGEQKKIEENDKEGEMEKKSIENKENKDESLSIDFGDFEESNINEQEIQSFSQNQKEFKNLEDQKKLTEKNKIETINFEPDSSNLDFNFQPINNNSSTFEFPIFTSTVSLNPNFNFEAIIQAKLPDELNLPEAKRTDIATDDLDFFDEMEVEKEREEILEERSKKEDYSLFGRKVDDIRKNIDDFKDALFSSSSPKRSEFAGSAEIKKFKLMGTDNNCNHDGMFNNETKEMIYAHLKKKKENFKKELLEYDQKLEFIKNTTQLNSVWQNSIIQKNLQKILEINVADNDLTHIDEVTIHKEKSKKKDEIKNKKMGANGSSSPVFDNNFIDKMNDSPKKNMKPVLLSKKEITKENKEEDVPPEVKEKIKNYLESLPNFDFLFSSGITTTH